MIRAGIFWDLQGLGNPRGIMGSTGILGSRVGSLGKTPGSFGAPSMVLYIVHSNAPCANPQYTSPPATCYTSSGGGWRP